MKRISLRDILLVCMMSNLLSSSLHAAVSDWFARQRQKSQEYVLRKINDAEQKTKELLASLQANSRCLVRGDCPPEKKKKLRTIATAIAAAVTIIVAVAIGRRYIQEDESGKVTLVSRGAIPNIQTVIAPFGVRFVVDDKPQNMFLVSLYNGGLATVQRYADLVRKGVLEAGIALADAMKEYFEKYDPQKIAPYSEIAGYIKEIAGRFSYEQQQANENLIRLSGIGVLAKVKELYCHKLRPTPSKNAVDFAREVAEQKGKKEIEDYLRNPICPAG